MRLRKLQLYSKTSILRTCWGCLNYFSIKGSPPPLPPPPASLLGAKVSLFNAKFRGDATNLYIIDKPLSLLKIPGYAHHVNYFDKEYIDVIWQGINYMDAIKYTLN